MVDTGLPETDSGVQLPVAWPDEPAGVREPERDEQQPGLVDMVVVLVITMISASPEPYTCRRRLAAIVPPSATENHDPVHVFNLRLAGPAGEGPWSMTR